jgi:hypothetical protein
VGFKVRLSLVALFASAVVGLSASAAQASLEIQKFVGINCKAAYETCGENGKSPFGETVEPEKVESKEQGFTQAGGRVPYGVTDFTVEHVGNIEAGTAIPTSFVTHVRVDVAPGLATSPANVPQCTMKEFGETSPVVAFGFYEAPECQAGGLGPHEIGPESTVIGEEKAIVYDGTGDLPVAGVLYNLEPPKPPAKARAALYGAALELPKAFTEFVLKKYGVPSPYDEGQYYAHTLVEGNVEWGKEAKGTGAGDYHDYFEVNVSTALPLVRSRQVDYGQAGNGAFITNGTSCPGHHTTTLTLEGVPPGDEAEVKESLESGVREVAKRPYETLIGLQGCNGEEGLVPPPFEPAFNVTSGSTASDQPNEITTEASEPQNPEEAVSQSQVKTASITLPEGMTLNPAAAYGLEDCTPAEARIHIEEFGVACPAGSALGTVSLEVPTLPAGSLTGKVYLGGPESGPITGPPYIIYIVANSARYGVSVRLKAEVIPNEATGQLTTVFPENEVPEQPFTNLAIHFDRGALTSVANPLVCGTPAGSATFVPVTGNPASKAVAFGVSVTECAAPLPFALTQSTEGDNVSAGAHTSYNFNLVRADGQQYLQKVKTTLPSGLVGEIPAITLCGEPKAAEGTCAAASRIGTATVTVGAGSFPYTFSGPVYMTGPYNGAPFGLSIAVPAVAGPFNFGTIVTRSTININQTTSRVTAESTLPTIVKGVPMRLRSISVNVNKQGFLLNPTTCSAEATETTLTSTSGTLQEGLTTPFQVEGCSGLAFKPTFTASTSGKPSKVNGASLVTTITQPAGQANIKSVFVQLPLQLPSRLTSLQKACLAKVFEANPYSCESASQVGTATAITPVLPGQMTGPVYLVSFGGEEFPQIDLVLEDLGVRVIVVGHTKITKGITTTNFSATPDVPVSSITVNLPLASNSALAANGNLCAPTLLMPTTITGQNGSVFKQNTVISPTGCGVQIIGHKVVGNTAYVTVKTFAAGRISGSGKGLSSTYRTLSSASKTATLKVPLSKKGRSRRRPFKVTLRVGFVPKKGAHSSATVTVKFRR